MIESVFVDSFAWIATINKSDNYHEICLRILEKLLNNHAKLIITKSVSTGRAGSMVSPMRALLLTPYKGYYNLKS